MIEKGKLRSEEGFNYVNRRYAMALLITASLLLVSQFIIQLTIINMKDDARVVNISGRQRMLSQKITKCVFGLLEFKQSDMRVALLAELDAARNLWKQSHEGLRYGSAAMQLPGHNSQAVEALYAKMEPHYQAILYSTEDILGFEPCSGACGGVCDGACEEKTQAALYANALTIRANEPQFLQYMDKIVFQYDAESNSKLFHLQILEGSILLIALCVLFLEWRVVFKPAQNEIRASFDVMKKNEEYHNQLF